MNGSWICEAQRHQEIEAIPIGDLPFLVAEFDAPFTEAGFGSWLRKRNDKEGCATMLLADMRKAGADLSTFEPRYFPAGKID